MELLSLFQGFKASEAYIAQWDIRSAMDIGERLHPEPVRLIGPSLDAVKIIVAFAIIGATPLCHIGPHAYHSLRSVVIFEMGDWQ